MPFSPSYQLETLLAVARFRIQESGSSPRDGAVPAIRKDSLPPRQTLSLFSPSWKSVSLCGFSFWRVLNFSLYSSRLEPPLIAELGL